MQGALIFLIVFIVVIVVVVALPSAIRAILSGGSGVNIFDPSGGASLLKSVDGGEAWSNIGGSFVRGRVVRFISNPINQRMLFVALEGNGLFKSEDGGETWAPVSDSGLGIQSTVYDAHFGNYEGSLALYLAVFQDGIGSLAVSTDFINFKRLYITPLQDVAVYASAQDPFDNQRLYVGTAQGGFLESTNGGESWRLVRWFPGAVSLIKVNPKNGDIFVYSNESRLFRSTDRGTNWIEVTNEITQRSQEGREISTIVFHPTEASIYAGSRLGLLRSADGGVIWSLVKTTVPPESMPIQGIALSQSDPRIIYIIAGTQLHISNDRGETWRAIQIPTKQTMVHLMIDQTNTDIFYVTTQ